MIKNCLVFGGSAGIGKSCAKKLLEEGNNVYLFSRNKKNLVKTQNEFSKFKGKIFIFSGDIGKKNHTDEFSEVIETGDDYYKKSIGQAFDSNVKLSKKSMGRFAYLYFVNSNVLENLADKVISKKNEELRKAVESIDI